MEIHCYNVNCFPLREIVKGVKQLVGLIHLLCQNMFGLEGWNFKIESAERICIFFF